MMSIAHERLREIVEAFDDQRILVAGDLMLDRYIYGTVSRISPEAPVPVVQVTREENMPGGASNVAWNICTLGAAATVCGFLGEDAEADSLEAVLSREGVSTDGIIRVPGTRTTVKTRIIADHQQVVRVDWDNPPADEASPVEALVSRIEQACNGATGLILEDYGKGVVSQAIVDKALAYALDAGMPSGFDPKDNHALKVDGVTVATPNHREAHIAVGMPTDSIEADPLSDGTLRRVGEELKSKWNTEFLLITLGAKGMLLVNSENAMKHIPTRAREVFDVSGAGDTVIATTVLALAAGASHEEAAELANYAAGVVVGKLGTAPCLREELMACLQ
jgi:D-beta-D-heptose 7-phosphate kinase/D-beta-D-heptose 1-phosphate adenosyltransferase